MTDKQLIFQVRQAEYIERKTSSEEGSFVKSIGKDNVDKIKRWIAAEKQGQELKKQAEKDSEAEIAKLAVLAAEKVLREQS